PWGWLVLDGREVLPPGTGPLSATLIVRRGGRVAWVDGDDLTAWRGDPDVAFAFQSYPSLLVGDGEVPAPLRSGDAINRRHRDARLGLGLDETGRILIVLTRLDIAVPGADRIPFGLTVPEMAAVMGGLGARRAMLLDGGISAQRLVREDSGRTLRWPGLRPVPLALVAGPPGSR
ncbi:MAG: phosphodiester glycosidase family protein, partial [Acidimicrobiales bacterium]